MSRVEERWLDSGSGPGSVVQVEVYESEDAESAYRRILDHGTGCEACRSTDSAGPCETATLLDRAWRAARRSREQGT
ncbi:hypothetical protein ACKI1J_38655 [Streptomyces scabiei]|uniref:hypothetical protein n=1 Tax=Streptomyces scabiei TaxID=1930 RepID=UPI0039EFB326